MKDRFRFRVFDYDENKMVYFSSLIGIETPHHDRSSQPNLYNDYVYHKISNYMQSTGLKDRNGKLIYEGDIVKVSGYGVEGIFKMFWEDVTAQFAISIYESDCFEHSQSVMEVIGNIYENKELLKEQK